ncbi:MAG: AgmX/PglI C-terminal domain-containing protein [Myxococcales bacterium]|nr:AgmX/PglI C-terminal domain-containing protein [Myxococcales bacterium]
MPARHSLSPLPGARPAALLLVGCITALAIQGACVRSAEPAGPSQAATPTPTASRAIAAAVEPAPAERDAPSAPSDAQPDVRADGDAGAGGATSDAQAKPAPAPWLVIETPYLAWARPRPKGSVAAGAHDEELARWNLGGTADPAFPSNRAGFHPGTRVKVDVRVTAGHLQKSAPINRRTGKRIVVLSETSLLARARKLGYWPYRLCFERALQAGDKPKAGETVLRFDVDASGRIGPPRVIRSKLTPAEVVACIVDKTRDIELLPPPRRISAELSVQLWPGDALLPSLPGKPAAATDEELDSKALLRIVEAERDALANCYAEGLGRDLRLWGRVQLHIELSQSGKVTGARETESRFPDREVSRCLTGAVSQMRFPERKLRPAAFELGVRLGREPVKPVASTP